MNTNEQGIIKMLQEKINESQERIKSFEQAIAALSGGGTVSSVAARPGKRRGRKPGSKNKAKAAVKAPAKSTPAKAKGRPRGRKAKAAPAPKAVKASPAKRAGRKAAKPKAARKTRTPRSGETMESWVISQLNDNTPKTARQLMDLYNKAKGKKLEMNGFSARLAIIKKKGNVKSMKNESDGLSYNGKSEWFDGNKLKKDYMPK